MFALIGERINTTRERMRRAVESREAVFIAEEARRQAAAGATHIDTSILHLSVKPRTIAEKEVTRASGDQCGRKAGEVRVHGRKKWIAQSMATGISVDAPFDLFIVL